MAGQDLLHKNLQILTRLNAGEATLEDLADCLKLPIGFLSTPLRVLQEQGLVREKDGSYTLSSESGEAQKVLGLVQPWLDHSDNTYYEIAKDIARIMLTKSWNVVGVKDVLLFGSTVRKSGVPSDIDLLILHNCSELKEFYSDPYGKEPTSLSEADQPVAKGNRRIWAWGMLQQLGYKGNDALLAGKTELQRWELERELEKDSAYNHVIARVAGIVGEIKRFDEAHVLDNLLDIHALSISLLTAPADEWQRRSASEKRAKAIKSCRDPTFWHTVLNEGRLYDQSKHDFTIGVEERYPGAVAMFEQK